MGTMGFWALCRDMPWFAAVKAQLLLGGAVFGEVPRLTALEALHPTATTLALAAFPEPALESLFGHLVQADPSVLHVKASATLAPE